MKSALNKQIDTSTKWKFSRKQRRLIDWWATSTLGHCDGIIAYGAVRSGKTVGMVLGFVLWAMSSYDGHKFAICGRSIGAVRRNVMDFFISHANAIQCTAIEKRADKKVVVVGYGHVNEFHLFGGDDAASYAAIQGITLAGVYFDEATLLNREFLNQALARCSVPDSKFWFNCNPEAPTHWFKKDFVDMAQQRKLLVMHFTMHDNLSLTPEVIERYNRSFAGVFYQRYVLGQWVISEGLVYPSFSEAKNVVSLSRDDLFIKDKDGSPLMEQHIGKGGSSIIKRTFDSSRWQYPIVTIDYGTANPTAMELVVWDSLKRRFVVIAEKYYDGHMRTQLDDTQKYEMLEELTRDIPIYGVIVDPSALAFITLIRNRRKYQLMLADNSVVPGISFTQTMINNGNLVISSDCKGVLTEFGQYAWDPKAAERGEDQPVKQFDHGLDALRYHAYSFVRRYARRFGVYTIDDNTPSKGKKITRAV